MLLKMRLYDSVGQRGAGLEFFQYSDFLAKFQYFWWLCWNFSETVRNIKKRFGLGCRNSKLLLKMCFHDSVGQKGTRLGFFNLQIFRKISIFLMFNLEFIRTVKNIKMQFWQGCRVQKVPLEMRLHDPVGQKVTWLGIFQYSMYI